MLGGIPIRDIENFVIDEIFNPYYNTVWEAWRQNPQYHPRIKEPQYPGQDLERANKEAWFNYLQNILSQDPLQIISWLEQYPKWKEKIINRFKMFFPLTFYKWLQCPIIDYLKSLGVNVKQ